ncbi:vitamin K epoxide reductase complex subunit 1-like protein 1 [Leptotrombidium deliense]|uniref:vitamin-K-epoxide reductase (warfarin-sensitive) n=1 Tax=Leptotrombidium deliense TaxID=299467 RepID=A0A443SWS1_9ACAR|nr:vitamin K epoxide reductase complex subunit 1-like protein 1 [Leptotrombidium deliense]
MFLVSRHSTFILMITTIVPLILSFYTLFVEHKLSDDTDYRALCDLADHISCTKAFKSRFAKGFGIFNQDSLLNIPNPIYGVLLYSTQLIIVLFFQQSVFAYCILLSFTVMSSIMSLYLAYILYKMKNLCVVCATIYFTNLFSLFISIYEIKFMKKFHYKTE